jgi:hypothetical protein
VKYDCLVINGDSYSAPTEFPVWGDYLAKDLTLPLHNLAAVGSNNKRILRSTIEFLESDPMLGKKTFVVIGWSFLNRQEIWYDGNDKQLLSRAPDNSDRDQNSKLKFITLDWILGTKDEDQYHKSLVLNIEQQWKKIIVDFYTDVFLLSRYLRSKNIDYLFFSAADNQDSDPYHHQPATDLHLCYSVLNDPHIKNLHGFCLSHWARDNDRECSSTFHLSEKGHHEFSKIIKGFIS